MYMYILHIYETNMNVVESRPFFAKNVQKNSKCSQACYEGKAYIAVVAFIHRHQMHGVGPLTMTNFVRNLPKIIIHNIVIFFFQKDNIMMRFWFSPYFRE